MIFNITIYMHVLDLLVFIIIIVDVINFYSLKPVFAWLLLFSFNVKTC